MSHPFPKSMTVKQAVISTLAYFDIFDVPLTAEEIYENLFFLNPDKAKIDIYLRESPLVHVYDSYYSLKRNRAFYEAWEGKRRRAKEFWKRVHRFQWLFNLCPFVRLVAVCNSLPIRAVEENSDIDLLVITEKKHMFLARFFLTILTSFMLVRRQGKWIRKRFCLSFYITEDNLDLNEIAQKPYDIYLAYWLKTLEPIAGDYNLYKKLINKNEYWMKPYFKTQTLHRRRFRKAKSWHTNWKNKMEKWFAGEKWEIRMRNWQKKRALEKYQRLLDPSGTVISEKMLKFHDKDVRTQIRHAWVERINEFV